MGGEILDGVVVLRSRRKTVYFVGELPLDTMNDRQRTAAWAHDDENSHSLQPDGIREGADRARPGRRRGL